jgi:hypothetical protein
MTKVMFLRELKEWGLVVVKYLPGSLLSLDLLTKNLPGPLFEKHSGSYVTDGVVEVEAKEQQVREAVGTMESAWHNNEVETPVKLKDVRLPSVGNHKRVNGYWGEEEVQMGEKCLYTDYSQVEVNETGWHGVVMNDKENGIDWMIGMETVKNG